MIKYVITSGVGMIKEFNNSEDEFDYTITNRDEESYKFSNIGDALRACAKINEYTNKNTDLNKYHPYRICSVEEC